MPPPPPTTPNRPTWTPPNRPSRPPPPHRPCRNPPPPLGAFGPFLLRGGVAYKSEETAPPGRPPDTTFERATCPCWGGPFHELDTPKCVGKSHTPHNAFTTGARYCDIGHTHKVAERY